MTNIVTNQSRQGDVLVIRTELPASAKPAPSNGQVILAYGEQTGHHHAFSSDRVTQFRDTSPGFFFTITDEPASLTHQEHAAIPHAPGAYRRLRSGSFRLACRAVSKTDP